ncbi:MAG: hemerythrin domain-containing protein [Desulfobacterales bacterium]|nr:hemerythrin domain-containing protein [Desulfobacterales bacterium]
MSKLVDELKKEHSVIAEILNKVKSLGIVSKEGQDIFLSAKNRLLEHIRKEDKQLYPVLKKAAESDTDLKQTLDIFAKDMGGISEASSEFFEKYSEGGSGIEFARDFGRLFVALAHRISREENIIYAKYEELRQ